MMKWDEENRLSALADNGKVHHYINDAGGNRTIKAKGDNQLVNINDVRRQTAAYCSKDAQPCVFTGEKDAADNYIMPVLSLSMHMLIRILQCTITSTPSISLLAVNEYLAN